MARPKAQCLACGRVVAVRFATQTAAGGAGKARVRHKCPHGVWCVTGARLAGRQGINRASAAGPHACRRCANRKEAS